MTKPIETRTEKSKGFKGGKQTRTKSQVAVNADKKQ
jgi:hypothetical protein